MQIPKQNTQTLMARVHEYQVALGCKEALEGKRTMKRSDKRRIDKGMIICDNGHWYKLLHHGNIQPCPRCTGKANNEGNDKETEQTDEGKRASNQTHREIIRPMD